MPGNVEHPTSNAERPTSKEFGSMIKVERSKFEVRRNLALLFLGFTFFLVIAPIPATLFSLSDGAVAKW